ncbi:MAG: alpha/beta fold hydrolase, partial [Promethearchaeota archaeon]
RWIRVLIKMTHFVEWYIKKKRTNPPETFINAYTHIANYPMGLKPHLAGITAPTLIIGGDQDQFFSISRFEETAELIPNSKLVFIEDAGHPAPLEKPKLVKKEVFKFLVHS